MGNTLPVTAPPKPSPTRAAIFMEPQSVRSYLREPWRRPVGELQIIDSSDGLPPAFDGVVPPIEYAAMMNSVADRAAIYRGGRIQIGVALFQACLFLVVMIGFILSRTIAVAFFNPISLGILGTLELVFLSQFGRFFQREEIRLKDGLLQLTHPWRQQYGIIANVRKSRGRIGEDGVGKQSSSPIYYCLLLERSESGRSVDTISLSTHTDIESDIESQV